jgi:hypothetical protein
MVSVITHFGLGIIVGEIILRISLKEKQLRVEKRPFFWLVGFIGGLFPDLDVIPAYITGQHPYAYHHMFTHTFLAIGILASVIFVTKFNSYAIIVFFAYFLHLLVDFFDNSISPLGPFLPFVEWGLLCGWQEMPCVNGVCGWASEFWLHPGYETHDVWSIFMNKGWGFPVDFEFISYYDLVLIISTTPLVIGMVYLIAKLSISNYKT